jgi:hypothetical protein
MPKVIRRIYDHEKKCGCCNNIGSVFYHFENLTDNEDICADCFMEMIVEENMKITMLGI